MTKISAILSLILILGCSVSSNSDETKESHLIVGKWIVEEMKFTGQQSSELAIPVNDSTLTLIDFFGPSNLQTLTGKQIEFKKNNTIATNWLDQAKFDKLKFTYDWEAENSLLVFSAVSPKDRKHITIPTKVSFHDSFMTWYVGDALEIKLNRIEE